MGLQLNFNAGTLNEVEPSQLQFAMFHGRANHYVGAILFYELTNPDNQYAQGTVTFQGTPVFSQTVQVVIDGPKTEFQSQFSRAMHVFASNDDSLTSFPEEASFLPGLIGTFCDSIRTFVKATYPATKFEVLYPHDVNDFTLTRVINYPDTDWTPSNLQVLKTENFTYTGDRKLDKAVESIQYPFSKGFPRNRSSHLIGVFGASEPWNWERRLAQAEAIESVVLWAFDQFSMIGYRLPLKTGRRRSSFTG